MVKNINRDNEKNKDYDVYKSAKPYWYFVLYYYFKEKQYGNYYWDSYI